MTKKTEKLATWAYSLIIAVIAWVVALAGFFIDSNNIFFAAALAIALAGTIIGVIQYLLTKRG